MGSELIILIVICCVGIFAGLPIVYTLIAGCVYYLWQIGVPSELIAVRANGFLSSFTMVTIPLFIFAALVMNAGGSTRRLLDLCMAIVGWMRGGLALVNIAIGVIFGGIAGAALSEAASIGSWMIPAMKKRGFKPAYAAAVTTAASTISPILPPGTALIVAAIIAHVSVIDVFIAAIIPGLVMGIGLFLAVWVVATIKGHPKDEAFSLRRLGRAFRRATVDLVLPFLIIGGVRFGWYTATEGSAVAVAYALFVGRFVHRELTMERLKRAALNAVNISGAVLFVVAIAATLAWILTIERIPVAMTNFALGFDMPGWMLTLAILVILLIVGAFMDGLAALIIFLPILLPLAGDMGMEPIQLIVFTVLTLVIGVVTPPFGVCLFITAAIARVRVLDVATASLPFVAVLILVAAAVGLVPALSMALL